MSKISVNGLTNVVNTASALVEDIHNMFKNFVGNVSATSGGLAVGALYYTTTDSQVTKVV